MKKLFLIVAFLTLVGCSKKVLTPLMEYDTYKNIKEDNIKKIEIIKYTEGGDQREEVDHDSIIKVYNDLNKIKIGKESNTTCEDNTTVYIITLTDDTKENIEIECDNIVINNKRYVLER